jgi:long-chain acyl-CoA synthetase
MQTILDLLDHFERRGNDCAYVFPRGYRHERWSYRRVADTSYRFARELRERKIEKGEAVLLWSSNCAEWVAAFLGCALCGVIAVPIDDQAIPDFARRISEQVTTRLVLCSEDRAHTFTENTAGQPAKNAEPATRKIATIDPADLELLVAKHSSDRFRPVEIEPSDVLQIVFTSGTTAEPKGVVITHANVAGNIAPIEDEIKKYLKYERFVHPLRFLNLLPLSHVFGQFLGIFLPPLLGAVVVFQDSLNPTEVMSTIRRERVSVLVAVPRMIESLRQKITRDQDGAGRKQSFDAKYKKAAGQHFLRRWWTFRRIRRQFGWKFWAVISGGAALDAESEEFWHRLGYAVIQGYGLTETTSLISLNHPFHTSRGSIGKVLPGREMKLADDGEILVRGGGVAKGYWSGRELQPIAESEAEGWYPTGDLGALDDKGNLFFKGRKKEVIVTPAGMNIYPQDLEAALREQKEVRDCVVVAVDRGVNRGVNRGENRVENRGENQEPCAVLLLQERDPASAAAKASEIVQRANAALPDYQKMHRWFVWPGEDFPRSATQKPRRNVIRASVEHALRGESVSGVDTPLKELIVRITGRHMNDVTPESSLESGLGLSSLERVELVGALEDRYQIDLSETNFTNSVTVGELGKLLQGEAGSAVEGNAVQQRQNGRTTNFHFPNWVLRWPSTWLRMAAHYLLLRPAVLILGRPEVIGSENLHEISGPLLVVSNHLADVDIGFIQYALPPAMRHKLATATRGEALEILRSPSPTRMWVTRIYNRVQWELAVILLNLFPLPQQSGFRKSFAYAGEAVDRGYSVLVFPEGKHSKDGKIGDFRSGIGLLAEKLRIPVLPIRIDGLFEIKNAGKKFAAPGKIQVRIGAPVRFAPGVSPEEIAVRLKEAVEKL